MNSSELHVAGKRSISATGNSVIADKRVFNIRRNNRRVALLALLVITILVLGSILYVVWYNASGTQEPGATTMPAAETNVHGR